LTAANSRAGASKTKLAGGLAAVGGIAAGATSSTIRTKSPDSCCGFPAASPCSGTDERSGLSAAAGAVGATAVPAVSGSVRKTMPVAHATNARRYTTAPVESSTNARQFTSPNPSTGSVNSTSVTG
jgi:hypothetical protein